MYNWPFELHGVGWKKIHLQVNPHIWNLHHSRVNHIYMYTCVYVCTHTQTPILMMPRTGGCRYLFHIVLFPSAIFQEGELLDNTVVLFFIIWRNSTLFPGWLHPSTVPPPCTGLPFLPSLAAERVAFHVPTHHLYIFCEKLSIQGLCPFLWVLFLIKFILFPHCFPDSFIDLGSLVSH